MMVTVCKINCYRRFASNRGGIILFRAFLIFQFAAVSLFAQQWERVEQSLTGSSSSFNSGSGHTFGDIDGDEDFDLFLNGSQRLWINKANEDNTFVSGQSMLPPLSGSGWAASMADFDNDGDPDIHCGNSGTDFLLENDWPNDFVNVAPTYNLTDSDWNQSINWVDYNKDGLPDIYITHELPDGDGPHEFYENDYPDPFIERFPSGGGEDTFGLADLNSHGYGVTWADVDLDGDIDAVTSACGSSSTIPGENPHNKIYRNNFPELNFTDMALDTGLVSPSEVSSGSASYWAMFFDYDGDAFPDLSIGRTNGSHRLWRNTGTVEGDFGIELVDAATHNTGGGGAFVDGACAGDYDNDGDLDIYTTPNGLYENNGDGSFTLRSNLVPGGGSDASFVDYDMDGNLDVFNFGDIYRNPGDNNNHWIAIELEGNPAQGTTRDAFHVKIRVTAGGLVQHREHRYMVGSYSQHLLPTHFGLGTADVVDEIQITWPNGTFSTYTDVPVDQYVYLAQGTSCSSKTDYSVAQDRFFFCPGEVISLEGINGEARPADPIWRVMEGPSKFPGQFSDRTNLETDFTAIGAGAYKIGLFVRNCPYPLATVDLIDTDYNGNGEYDEGDVLVSLANWQTTNDLDTFDRDGNGVINIIDALQNCALSMTKTSLASK